MHIWYTILALANLIAGGFLVVSAYAFEPSTTSDVGFAVSIAVGLIGTAMGYVGFMSSNRDIRIGLGILGWATAGLASWTVIATRVFEDDTARWLVFGSGLGHIALSVAGIITHEATFPRRRT
jgi:hypothetical protein